MRGVLIRVSLAALAVVALIAVAGCGSSGNAKLLEGKPMRRIETAIKKQIESQRKGVHVLYVHCPKSVEKRKGIVFACAVRGKTPKGAASATAVVTETDDRGTVHYLVR